MDNTTCWTFTLVCGLIPLTLVGAVDGDCDEFTDEGGRTYVYPHRLLENLDPEIPEGYSYDGDPGELSYWWTRNLFSTKEKALEARRFAFEEAIDSLEMRIETSKMQIKEDKEEIERLQNQMNEED